MGKNTPEAHIPTADYDIGETLEIVGIDAFEELNRYQLETPLRHAADDPVPRDTIAEAAKTDRAAAERITHSRTIYSPEIEAMIESDAFMRRVRVLKSRMRPLEYAIARRSRRTVLAALALHRTLN